MNALAVGSLLNHRATLFRIGGPGTPFPWLLWSADGGWRTSPQSRHTSTNSEWGVLHFSRFVREVGGLSRVAHSNRCCLVGTCGPTRFIPPSTRRPPGCPTSLEVINKFKCGCPISRVLCEKWGGLSDQCASRPSHSRLSLLGTSRILGADGVESLHRNPVKRGLVEEPAGGPLKPVLLEWGLVVRFGLYLPSTRRPRSSPRCCAPMSVTAIYRQLTAVRLRRDLFTVEVRRYT